MSPRRIRLALLALIALDVVLAGVAFFLPNVWFAIFHGTEYVDPQGLLRRCAANWAAFALFQAVAYAKWEKNSAWLAIVAGLRLSDIFTDWAYLAFAQNLTWFGWLALALAPPTNLFAGWKFLKWHDARRANDKRAR
jgi:hypothetical protein